MEGIITVFITISLFWLFFYNKNRKPKPISDRRRDELKREAEIRKNEIENDKDRLTKEQVRDFLVKLNVTPFVLGLFDETKNLIDYDFYNHFTAPYHIIESTKKEQLTFKTEQYIPLFESSYDFGEVLAYDKINNDFSDIALNYQ